MSTTAFRWSDDHEPHRARTQALLKSHPDGCRFIGRNLMTALMIGAAVVVQLALCFAPCGRSPGGRRARRAWLFGAFVDHALFVMVHECAHDLVFKRRWANAVASLVANLLQFFPTAVSSPPLSPQASRVPHACTSSTPTCRARQARLVQNSALGKAAWMLLFPLFQIARTFRLREIQFFDWWVTLNWAVQLVFNAGCVVAARSGRHSCTWPARLRSGLHPLGARWIQEHYLTDGDHGDVRLLRAAQRHRVMNVGHHNEHHDLPSVSRQHLPAIRREEN